MPPNTRQLLGAKKSILIQLPLLLARNDRNLIIQFPMLINRYSAFAVGECMFMQLTALRFAGQLAKFLTQNFLIFDSDVLVAEEDNAALDIC